ncbi:AhpD-like protein [Desarmillaria tabescens]|uniref:AhpD-like protein n=1 Tax=Armillaria tabescens TaxID=1929756 RepID=A0AA39K1F1_ARMTA|nr:AhpD-like protein [Desarmillaria tabescens]KAK0452755.1 AhpD-like protein [Desarmillaria tabescens]
MVGIATRAFLARLEALFPKQKRGFTNPCSLVTAAAFSSSNLPEAVPEVFKYASESLKTHEERLLLARKMREVLFKAGMLSGFPKAINALGKLHAVVPYELRDTKPLRDASMSIEALTANGQGYFDQTYGETAYTVQPFLREIYPDFALCTSFVYGYTYSFFDILSPAETSFAMVAALIANDTPRQIDWHLQGSLRNGATLEEVKAVRQIAIEVAMASGVKWKNAIPDISSQ